MRRYNTFVFFLFYAASSVAQEGIFKPLSSGKYLSNPSYVVDFDEESRIAFWVHYELKSYESRGAFSRTDDFRVDVRSSSCASVSGYRGSGYDRGHLKPAGDSKSSSSEMSQSFLMTNMFPQTPSLNRGVWRVLEQDVRDWAGRYSQVHITTGPSKETKAYLSQGLRVPAYCWKAILRTAPDTSVIAFFMPNTDQVTGVLKDYVISVDALEARIGVDLFPALPNEIEAKIEREVALIKWDISEGGEFARSGFQCLGIAASTRFRCGNFTPNENKHCHLHQSQSDSPINTGLIQCKGIASSTRKQCRNMVKDPSGYCHFHKPSGHPSTIKTYPEPNASESRQCSGKAKSTGQRCRNKTTHSSGRCHHHRD